MFEEYHSAIISHILILKVTGIAAWGPALKRLFLLTLAIRLRGIISLVHNQVFRLVVLTAGEV